MLDLRNLQEQVEKTFCFKNNSDLYVHKQIVLVMEKLYFVTKIVLTYCEKKVL